jgi:hypothetical protein
MTVKAFFLEPTRTRRIFLRRSSFGKDICTKNEYGCDSPFVSAGLPDEPFEYRIEDGYRTFPPPPQISHDDPHWPLICEHCGRPFSADADWRVDQEEVYRRIDTGEIFAGERNFPDGALWYAEGYLARYYERQMGPGPDGHILMAKCPGGGVWCIDSRASNCTMKDDAKHRCWVRHGDPRTGMIHVDKNGLTCAAGAGSIQTHNWHGSLHNGEFSP